MSPTWPSSAADRPMDSGRVDGDVCSGRARRIQRDHLSIVNLIMIAVVGALGLNILVGSTGQISVGHGALMSVGAYTAANLITRLDAPFWVALPAGGAMAAAIGAVIGVPSLRIKGLYLAIATLAGQLIIE